MISRFLHLLTQKFSRTLSRLLQGLRIPQAPLPGDNICYRQNHPAIIPLETNQAIHLFIGPFIVIIVMRKAITLQAALNLL